MALWHLRITRLHAPAGASGSGKTHTVLGSKQSPGLVDRITDEVFARYDQRTCTVSVSVEELYCVSAMSRRGQWQRP
jgi:hypothetical protein